MFEDQQKNVKLTFKRPIHFTDQPTFDLGASTSNRLSFVNPGKQIPIIQLSNCSKKEPVLIAQIYYKLIIDTGVSANRV